MGTVTVTTIASATETITKDKLNGLAGNLVSEFNGNIDNDNIKANAGILASKLNLASPGVLGGTTPNAVYATTISGSNIILGGISGGSLTLSSSSGISQTVGDNSNAIALTVTQSDVTNNPIAAQIENDGTNHGVYVKQDGVLASGKHGLYVYSEAAQDTSSLVNIVVNQSSASAGVVKIQNSGAGSGLAIIQTGDDTALSIDSEATTTTKPSLIVDSNHGDGGIITSYRHNGTQVAGVYYYDGLTTDSALVLGTYRIWVDTNGKLRLKDGVPASDTDGNIVGP